jgi:hypothetical protein
MIQRNEKRPATHLFQCQGQHIIFGTEFAASQALASGYEKNGTPKHQT